MFSIRERNRNKLLYLPLEIYDRELDGALLLALEAVKRNWEVILGSQEEIVNNIENSLPGVYFLKHITPGQIKIQKRIKNAGNIMFAQDQEGLLQRPGLPYKIRFSEKSMSETEKIFFWGKQQKKDFIDSFGSKYSSKCIVTGCPRADHWELIAEKDNNSKKEFILITTTFSHKNHALGDKGQHNLLRNVAGIKYGANTSESIDDHFKKLYELDSFLIPFYKELVVELSKKFKNQKIILRPHPSESLDMWQNLTSDLKNVEIRNDGTIIEWLKKSKLLIQYGSSCAIQANILKVPVLTLIPKLKNSLKKYDLIYPRNASIVCEDINSFLKECEKIINRQKSYLLEEDTHLDKLIYSRKTADSSKRIIDEIEKIYKNNEKAKIIKDGTAMSYGLSKLNQKIVLLFSIIPFWEKFAPSKYKYVSLAKHNYYKKRKQPRLKIKKFEDNLKLMMDISELKFEVGVNKYLKNVYKLQKK